jgi:2-polyprenyl-6-hydroxyphenyl methylase/3-demethylubiquinone-9 3-methyltransferase
MSQNEKYRFGFGKNWQKFLSVLNNDRIVEAEKSLQSMLGVENLKGRSFLDIGSGSGLFSLAARRLGAHVHSFDYDKNSVAATQSLQEKYFPQDSNWKVEQGSVLDTPYVSRLGEFDVVYSWGVLHHTGDMWKALENAALPLKKGGLFFIAIYNDQGWKSDAWTAVKKIYNSSFLGYLLVCSVFLPYFIFKACVKCLVKGENVFATYKSVRGMSIYYDWFDWLGGYPFQVAGVEQIKKFYEPKGFVLQKLTTTTSLGNNEFVFRKV